MVQFNEKNQTYDTLTPLLHWMHMFSSLEYFNTLRAPLSELYHGLSLSSLVSISIPMKLQTLTPFPVYLLVIKSIQVDTKGDGEVIVGAMRFGVTKLPISGLHFGTSKLPRESFFSLLYSDTCV